MRHRVGIAKAPGKALVQRNVDDLLAAHPVHHEHAFYENRLLLHQLADAQGIDGMPGVGRELDAGADLAELMRLLQDQYAEILAGEGQRGGEPADAAAGDHDRLCVTGGAQKSSSDPDLQHVVVGGLRVGHVDALQLYLKSILGLLELMGVRAGKMPHVVAAQLHHVEPRTDF